MDNQSEDISSLRDDIDSISFEERSRSSRWKETKKFLRSLARHEDAFCDRLAFLEEEIKNVRADSLIMAEALQALSDVANVEVQREISSTLNDTDFEIVIDKGPLSCSPLISETETTMDGSYDLTEELKELPGIGQANAHKIAEHVKAIGDDKASELAVLLKEIRQSGASQQSLFSKEGE